MAKVKEGELVDEEGFVSLVEQTNGGSVTTAGSGCECDCVACYNECHSCDCDDCETECHTER